MASPTRREPVKQSVHFGAKGSPRIGCRGESRLLHFDGCIRHGKSPSMSMVACHLGRHTLHAQARGRIDADQTFGRRAGWLTDRGHYRTASRAAPQAPNSAAPQHDPQHRPAGHVLDAGQQLGLGGPAAAAVMAHAVQAAGVRNLRGIARVLARWDGPSACYPVRTSRGSAVAEEITSLQLRHRCSHPVALVGPPGELA